MNLPEWAKTKTGYGDGFYGSADEAGDGFGYGWLGYGYGTGEGKSYGYGFGDDSGSGCGAGNNDSYGHPAGLGKLDKRDIV